MASRSGRILVVCPPRTGAGKARRRMTATVSLFGYGARGAAGTLAACRNVALKSLDRRRERLALPQHAAPLADRPGGLQHLLRGIAQHLRVAAHRKLLDPPYALPQLEAVAGVRARLAQRVRHDQGNRIGLGLEIVSRLDPTALVEEIDPIGRQAGFRSTKMPIDR